MGTIHVLHVDDDPSMRDLASTALARQGDIEVASEGDPGSALARLEAESFDCVVSDYEMPGTDGLELLRAVREADIDLPFILFTGKGSEEIASEAISAGVDDYIQKQGGAEQYELLANRVRNLVDRRRAERERAESERQLATLMDNVPGMAYRCRNEPNWPMEFVSQGCEALTGYTPEQIESGEVGWAEDVLHPEDAGELWDPVQAALKAREPFEVTYRIRTADGEQKWMWERGRGVFADDTPRRSDAEGGDRAADAATVADRATDAARPDDVDPADEVVALEGFVSDVTDRKRIESELRTLNEKVGALHVEARRLGDADDVATVWERAVEAAETVLAFEDCFVCEAVDGRFVTRATSEAMAPIDDDPASVEEGVAGRTYRTGEGVLVDDVADVPDADPPDESIRSAISVPVGDVGVFQAVATDPGYYDADDLELATLLMDHVAAALERVRSAAELRAERDRFAALFEQVPDPAVVAAYEDGERATVRSVNSAFEETFGYDEAAIVGEPLNDLIVPPDRREEGAAIDERVIAGEQVECEVRRQTNDGTGREFLFRSVTVDGDPPVGFGVYTDITERKRHEAELERQNERLDAFASVVSHDLRTPLNVAAGHLELAAEECDSEHLETAVESLDGMQGLVDDVLALARGDEDVKATAVSLPDVARRVWSGIEAPATLRVESALDDDGTVLASEDALARLLENLFRNALEHVGPDVTVTVGAHGDGFFVEDDGPGIPPGERDPVFEQGVSLDGDGTGIGLAIVRQVATAHDWDVRVETGTDGGARFVLTGVERPA